MKDRKKFKTPAQKQIRTFGVIALLVIIFMVLSILSRVVLSRNEENELTFGSRENEIIQFANEDNNMILEEQRAYHENVMNQIKNVEKKLNEQEQQTIQQSNTIEKIKNQGPKTIIIKDKRSQTNENKKDVAKKIRSL